MIAFILDRIYDKTIAFILENKLLLHSPRTLAPFTGHYLIMLNLILNKVYHREHLFLSKANFVHLTVQYSKWESGRSTFR